MIIQQNPKILSKRVGSQWVILESNKKYVRQLNPDAGQIWNLAKNPISTDEIISVIAKKNKTPKKEFEHDIITFIKDYIKNNLFVEIEDKK
jgi:DNA-directed RNA polymerase delta subunit